MVQDRLQGIVSLQGNHYAFAAVTEEGSLVTWGKATLGGDSSTVQGNLRQKVRQAAPSSKGFFAILEDRSLIYWGQHASGIGMSAVKHQLTSVRQVCSTMDSFAALRQDGSVVTWGSEASGGNSCSVQAQLQDVQEIFATSGAFAAFAPMTQSSPGASRASVEASTVRMC